MLAEINRRDISRRASAARMLNATLLVLLLAPATPSIAMPPADDPPSPASSGQADDASVTEFTLSGNLSDDWFERPQGMPNLRKLTIKSPGQKLHVSRLAESTQLESFQTKDFPLESRLADIMLVNVSRIPNLRDVTFERTGLTSPGLRPLAESSDCDGNRGP